MCYNVVTMKKILFKNLIVVAFALVIGFYSTLTVNKTVAYADEITSNKSKEISNIIALVDFDNDEMATTEFLTYLDQAYNTSELSMKNFFLAESLGKLTVESKIITPISIKMDKKEEYYSPRYEYNSQQMIYVDINPDGYDNRYYLNGNVVSPDTNGGLEHIERVVREQLMLREIAEKLSGKIQGKNADSDGDGKIDALTVILDNSSLKLTGWDSILWPHMSYAYVIESENVKGYYVPEGMIENNPTLKEKVVIDELVLSNYNLLTTSYIESHDLGNGNSGVMCHEFLHNLGLYDYYYYLDQSYQPVGELDILGVTKPIPQFNLSYLRQKMGWLEDGVNILPLETSGEYTLNAVTSSDPVKAYKLVLNDYADTGEYFMIEMRTNTDGFDGSLLTSGLIVYRINERNGYINSVGQIGYTPYGNMYGGKGKEEVYVYRMSMDDKTILGNTSFAILDGTEVNNGYYYDKSQIGSTDISVKESFYLTSTGLIFKKNYYSTSIHYSDGTNSGIYISDITISEDKKSASFSIEFKDTSLPISQTDNASLTVTDYGVSQAWWKTSARIGNAYILQVNYDDNLVTFDGDNAICQKYPSKAEMVAGKMEGYNTVNSQKVPISFKKANISEQNGTATFVMLEDGKTNQIIFAGAVKKQNSNQIIQVVGEILDIAIFRYIIYGIIGICVIGLLGAILKRKK